MQRSRTSIADRLSPTRSGLLTPETALAIAAGAIAFALAIRFEAFEWFATFAHRFEPQQLDEAAVAIPAFLLVLVLLFLRRERSLRAQLQRSEARERVAYAAARKDALTGLANPLAFVEALERACAHDEPFCLIVIDLDGFKSLNDQHGHAAGDEALRHVGDLLGRVAESAEALCTSRIGGDEFGMIVGGRSEPDCVAARIVLDIGCPFVCDGGHAQMGASLGLARRSDGSTDSGELLKRADAAMYRAKRAGGGSWREHEQSHVVDPLHSLPIPRRAYD